MLVWILISISHQTFGDFCQQEPDLCYECRESANCKTVDKDAVIPQTLLTSTRCTTILYAGNESAKLDSRMFNRYPNLTSIILFGQNIAALEEGVFKSLLKLEILKIYNTNINFLPDHMIPTNSLITELDLHNNRLTTIPYHLFQDTPRLIRLNLGYNKILNHNCSTIGWEFETLTQLKKLDLSNFSVPETCKLEIPADFFKPIQRHVEFLNLTLSNVFGGSQKIFQNFTTLEELDISLAKSFLNCPSRVSDLFSYLPSSLQTLVMRRWRTYLGLPPECAITSRTMANLKLLPRLTKLDMKYGDLIFGETLKRSIFSGFNFLEKLDVGFARFSSVEDFVFDGCPNLTHLTMDANPVGVRTMKLFQNRSLSKLEHLKLKRANIFSDFSINYHAEELFREAPIKILDLKLNWLAEMPFFGNDESVAADFDSLETVRLDFNYLVTLESGGNLSSQCNLFRNLKKLSLSNNRITKVQGLCASITTLNLSFNNLHIYWNSLNEAVISKLIHLRVLDISFNQIELLSGDLFSEIKNLTELYLRGNNITTLDSSLFASNLHLEFLDLRANALLELKTPLIEHLHQLQEVLLEYNDITLIDKSLLSYVNNETNSVKAFGLVGNPFLCDCTQQFFQDWIITTDKVPFANKLECSEPAELKSQKVYAYVRDTYNCDYRELVNVMISVIGGIVAAVIIVLPCYKYRWYVCHAKVVIRAVITQLSTVRAELKCSYDAYVMYNSASDEDLNWVIQDLRLALENDSSSTSERVTVLYFIIESLGGK